MFESMRYLSCYINEESNDHCTGEFADIALAVLHRSACRHALSSVAPPPCAARRLFRICLCITCAGQSHLVVLPVDEVSVLLSICRLISGRW